MQEQIKELLLFIEGGDGGDGCSDSAERIRKEVLELFIFPEHTMKCKIFFFLLILLFLPLCVDLASCTLMRTSCTSVYIMLFNKTQ